MEVIIKGIGMVSFSSHYRWDNPKLPKSRMPMSTRRSPGARGNRKKRKNPEIFSSPHIFLPSVGICFSLDANPEVTSPAKGSWSLVQPLPSEHKQDGGVGGGRGGEGGRGGDSQLVHSTLPLERSKRELTQKTEREAILC